MTFGDSKRIELDWNLLPWFIGKVFKLHFPWTKENFSPSGFAELVSASRKSVCINKSDQG